jgi:hypothetical protein
MEGAFHVGGEISMKADTFPWSLTQRKPRIEVSDFPFSDRQSGLSAARSSVCVEKSGKKFSKIIN